MDVEDKGRGRRGEMQRSHFLRGCDRQARSTSATDCSGVVASLVPSMITTETRYFAHQDESIPAVAVQVTTLVNSYMVWIGTTDRQPEQVQRAPSEGNLCRDWACAMPPLSVRRPFARLHGH